MGKTWIFKSTIAGLAMLPALSGTCVARPDDQGWGGPGWYISSGSKATLTERAAYILFNGPHEKQAVCAEVYDRLYSPIGTCRYLEAKPGLSRPASDQ